MYKTCRCFLVGLVLVGCGSPQARSSTVGTSVDSARLLFVSVPPALAERGPVAWLDFFEDSAAFFMASDGALAFSDRPAAEAFLADFAPTVSSMELEWHDLRFEDLGRGVVVVTSSYRETIRSRDGAESSFGGRVSGVIRQGADGWRFQHLHWSSAKDSTD